MSDNIKNEDFIEQIAKAVKTAEAKINIDELIKNLDEDKRQIVLKATGIGMLAEITNLICTDAGYATLGKSVNTEGYSNIEDLMNALLVEKEIYAVILNKSFFQ